MSGGGFGRASRSGTSFLKACTPTSTRWACIGSRSEREGQGPAPDGVRGLMVPAGAGSRSARVPDGGSSRGPSAPQGLAAPGDPGPVGGDVRGDPEAPRLYPDAGHVAL